MYDLNTAETGSSFDLLPEGTVARAMLSIKQGGAGEGGWFKLSKGGDPMLDCKWVITEGKFAKRHVFDNMMMGGNEKAVAITQKSLRALIESHFGILPSDMSEQAMAARRLTSIGQLNGMEGCLLIGIERDPEHGDRNRVKALFAPGETRYLAKGQLQQNAPSGAAAAAAGSYQAPPAYGATQSPGAGSYAPPAYGAQPAPAANADGRPAWAQ